ncbi:urea ABC transporter permease subunit UrtC [Nocardiopsis tropica]|uniref:Urea ABC transporter permease subunit UrtC n=1 Tax=Nocardiopsis tropica TaxID=109330 RepID=A0ABU7KTT7_9ACTN|nr:urea ABC transporter permease subunit UrtC [Nocardiopsis umidischolae]MEE2052492.1 urea ABC transporter permease subunit UrtC [Nocardiopsis umidischolae]
MTPTPEPGRRMPLARLRGPATFLALLAAALLLLPHLLEPFRLNLLTQYLCYSIVALGIALAWGRGGMLTLGHGVYFGLGAYAMAIHLTLAATAADPLTRGQLPQFMTWSGLTELPWFWQALTHPAAAVTAALLLPTALATLLGWSVFRQRVRGAYFALLNQALAAAFVILLIGQQHLTGGSNGLTDFPVFAGHSLYTPTAQTTLYTLTVLTLAATYLLLRHLTHSRYGRLLIAIRDGEDRVRYLGYDPTWAKTLAYALSATAAGAAGALFVPVMGIISPTLIGVVPSIMMVLAVAIGGRHSLAGAAAGALIMNTAQTTFSETFTGGWTYLQGALFVIVIALAPHGLAGLAHTARAALRRPPTPAPAQETATARSTP